MVSKVVKRLYSVKEVAEYLGVTTRTVYNLYYKGVLKVVRIRGLRRLFFDIRDIERLLTK